MTYAQIKTSAAMATVNQRLEAEIIERKKAEDSLLQSEEQFPVFEHVFPGGSSNVVDFFNDVVFVLGTPA
jgi:hypothetical protein